MSNSKIVNSSDLKILNKFSYQKHPSEDRLRFYLQYCDNDRGLAIRLYGWNIAISAALYPLLQIFEVTLRESLIYALENRFGLDWYNDIEDLLDPWTIKKIDECRAGLHQGSRKSSMLSIANKFSLGFWVSLVAPKREQFYTGKVSNLDLNLWSPAIRGAFPYGENLNQKLVKSNLLRIKRLRNLIAHYEPIYLRELEVEYQIILDTLSWMSPEIHSWVVERSRVIDVLKQRNNPSFVKF